MTTSLQFIRNNMNNITEIKQIGTKAIVTCLGINLFVDYDKLMEVLNENTITV